VFRRTAAGAAILAATTALPLSSAQAGGVSMTNCFGGFGYGYSYGYGGGSGGGYGSGSCVETWHKLVNPYVIQVPAPQSEQDVAETASRERLWEARCKPVIRQDQYGVRRYHYAAPGCENGKYE
jgi:hypothetical protein